MIAFVRLHFYIVFVRVYQNAFSAGYKQAAFKSWKLDLTEISLQYVSRHSCQNAVQTQ